MELSLKTHRYPSSHPPAHQAHQPANYHMLILVHRLCLLRYRVHQSHTEITKSVHYHRSDRSPKALAHGFNTLRSVQLETAHTGRRPASPSDALTSRGSAYQASKRPLETHGNGVHAFLGRTVLASGFTGHRELASTATLHIRAGIDALVPDARAHGEGSHVGGVTRAEAGGAEGVAHRGLLRERAAGGEAGDALLRGGDAEGGTAEGEAGVAG